MDKEDSDDVKTECEEGLGEVLKTMHDLGMNCGREISRLAKVIHPDCIAVVPLYRSCIVIIQSEEQNKEGTCTIHAYADPHWMGKDINIETLKEDEFHFEFNVHGQRSGPELIFSKDKEHVRMPINYGFNMIEMAEKCINEMFKELELKDEDQDETK